MAPPDDIDPRLSDQSDIRPVVALPREGLPVWALAAVVLLAALLLFVVLEARRQTASAPAVRPQSADLAATPADLPTLYVPPAPIVRTVVIEEPAAKPAAPTIVPPRPPAPPPPRYYPPPQQQMMMPSDVVVPRRVPPKGEGTALVYDDTVGDAAEPAAQTGPGAAAVGAAPAARARATVLRSRATTVPQGTLIPAVLETAFDSNRPGLARALVTRDVRGFDGSRVLIPRGSRLIGQYQADLEPGQNRALINWSRLVRPDGAMIAIGSPAADPLGRIGVRGRVDSHFLERFGLSILQTALDVGAQLAIPDNGRGYILALPNSLSASTGLTNGTPPRPTLRIKQGSAITVFVARDLDFTGVSARK